MLIVAHRGDLDHFPEDSAEGIVAAAALGVDGIEFDVHQTADGVWYVIHDSTLRTCSRASAITAGSCMSTFSTRARRMRRS